jgi:uracil-DNA glycosylase
VRRGSTLTEVVRAWRDFLPSHIVLPHPSPRNELWLRRNPWFEAEVVPVLQRAVREVLDEAP